MFDSGFRHLTVDTGINWIEASLTHHFTKTINVKKLSHLLPIPAADDRPVRHLTLDSRAVQNGDVFFACQGLQVHGRDFIHTALQQGAAAVLVEQADETIEWRQNVPCIGVPELSQQLGALAARFYGHPSRHQTLVGVTGTNGKTSIAHFLAQCLPQPSGFIGTIGYGVYGHLHTASHTTPDALRMQALLADLRAQGVSSVAMEVSSHALDQGRVADVEFNVAVLSNLSRDHLDYHGTLAAYAAAKARLFHWSTLNAAVLNWDDAFGRELLQSKLAAPVLTYSLSDTQADIYVLQQHTLPQGYRLQIHTPQGDGELLTALLGSFNISNLLAALGTLLSLDMPLDEALRGLSQIQPVSGRMEVFHQAQRPTVVVDYAHTPDALEQALRAVRPHCQGQLCCVFGCGGDRDQGKRPLMGAIAEQWADRVILTNDNPRYEDPEQILQAILQGMQQPERVRVIPDRHQALECGITAAKAQDVVLIAGKGHEDYQLMGQQRLPFSDQAVVQAVLNTPCNKSNT